MPKRREYRPRKPGKKIDTWHLDVDGRQIEVEVRMLSGKLWVNVPECKIDIKDTDVQSLRDRVEAAIAEVQPIAWTDVIALQIGGSDDDFPSIQTETYQNGTDTAGKMYHRHDSRSPAGEGHVTTGASDRYWGSERGFKVVMPKDKHTVKMVETIEAAAGQLVYEIAELCGLTAQRSGGQFSSVDQAKVDAAMAKIVKRGLVFKVELGKPSKDARS